MKGMNRKKGLTLVIIGAVLWGISGTVSQKLFQQYHVNVNGLVTIRLLVAGVLLLGMQSFRSTRSHVFDVWRNKWSALRLLIFGLLGMLAVQYTYMASIKHGNAAVATLLQYLAPVMIILYLLLRRRTVFSRHDAVTVSLALMGCFLLLTNGSVSNLSVPPVAVVWGLLSGLALAFYTLYSVPLLAQFDSQVIVGWAMIIGGVALSLIHPPWQIDFSSFSPVAYMYLLFVIVFGTMIAFWFYIESLQSLSPKETSLFSSLEPLAAVLTTVFWLKEPFGIFQWVGTLCIFGMILLLAFQKKPSSKEKEVVETNYNEKSDVG